MAISKKWKEPEKQYRAWYKSGEGFELGSVQFVQVEDDIWIANLIGQHKIRKDENGNPVLVPPTGKMFEGMLHTPVIVGDPDKKLNREEKIFSSSAGTTEVLWEKKEKTGFYYWRDH